MQGLDVGLLGTLPADPAAPTRPDCAPEPARPRRPPHAAGPEVTETGHVGLAPPHPARRPAASLVPRAVRALAVTARQRRPHGGCRSRTRPTSCAASSPTAARTCRSPRRSRSAGCSRCRSSSVVVGAAALARASSSAPRARARLRRACRRGASAMLGAGPDGTIANLGRLVARSSSLELGEADRRRCSARSRPLGRPGAARSSPARRPRPTRRRGPRSRSTGPATRDAEVGVLPRALCTTRRCRRATVERFTRGRETLR